MSSKKPFDVKKPTGRRRGRKPKNEVTNDFAPMYVLPPNVLQKLGINLNIGNVEITQAATTAASLSNDPLSGNNVTLSEKKQYETNINIQPFDAVAVTSTKTDSSILETANLMKTSVFLSPTFNPVPTNIVNAEIEFLSLNHDETGEAERVEKQGSDGPLFFTTAECINSTAEDTALAETAINEMMNSVQGVNQESEDAKIVSQPESIEVLRKEIQSVIENVLPNGEETDDVEHAGKECYNKEDDYVDKVSKQDFLSDPFPVYLSKTINDHRSPGNNEAFLEQNDEPLCNESELNHVPKDKITVNSECITTSNQSGKHSLVNGNEKSYDTKMLSQGDTVGNAAIQQNVQNFFSNDSHNMIQNIRQAVRNETVLTNENEDMCPTELSETTMSRISSACYQQEEHPQTKMKPVARKEKAEFCVQNAHNIFDKFDHANVLYDDHLDEAYLSDCSNSNLGSSGNTMSAQETFETPTKELFSDLKNSKISILSQEIIEPSKFSKLCEIAKKSHHSDNLIPVSIKTVVCVSHKNIYPDSTKITNKNNEEKSTVVSSFLASKHIQEVDRRLSQTADSPTNNTQVISAQWNADAQILKEETTSEFELLPPTPGESKDYNSVIANPPLNNIVHSEEVGNKPEPNEKVEEIASYLAKFAHILTHRKKNALNTTGENLQNVKKNITTSTLTKEGVEKPGGSDNIEASEIEDESQCKNVWRTYRISQKLPARLNNNWDSRTALNITHEDNINLQELTAVDDIDVNFNVCDEFGSFSYYEDSEDLDNENHTSGNLINHPIRFSKELFQYVASTAQIENNAEPEGNTEQKKESFIDRTTEAENLRSFSLEGFLVDPLANSYVSGIAYEYAEPQDSDTAYRNDDDFLTESKYELNIRLSKFDAVDHELDLDDKSFEEVFKYFDFEANSLLDEETADKQETKVAGCAPTHNNDEKSINITSGTENRRYSDVTNVNDNSDVTMDCIKTASSSENNIKCGVCHKILEEKEWSDHLSNEHCYIAWKDGETIDLKSNTLLSNLNNRLNISGPLKCTFCCAEYKTCKKFVSHIRQCLEKYKCTKKINETNCVCAVCHEKVESDKWFEHIKDSHHYIAWREGETPIELEQDVKRVLDSVLMLHGFLKCSEYGISFKSADSFIVHIKSCGASSSNHREDTMRRRSDSSESDMKIVDLKGILDSDRKIFLRNSQNSPEPFKHNILDDFGTIRSNRIVEKVSHSSQIERRRPSYTSSRETCNVSSSRFRSRSRLSSIEIMSESEHTFSNSLKKIGSVKTLLPQNPEPRDPAAEETQTPPKRKRGRPKKINNIDQSQQPLPNSYVTEDTDSENQPSRSTQKPTSYKTRNLNKSSEALGSESGETKELDITTRSKRKCRGKKYSFQTELDPEDPELLKPNSNTNLSGNITRIKDKTQKSYTKVRNTDEKQRNKSSIEDSTSEIRKDEDQNAVSYDETPSNLKSEPVDNENMVECGVCQNQVESNAWTYHSQMKHQYLAWHTGQTALDLEDDTEVLEHLKTILKNDGSLTCSKCGLMRKYAKPFLTHIRSCQPYEEQMDPLDNSLHLAGSDDTSLNSTIKSERICNDDTSSAGLVTCAVCNKTVKCAKWQAHAFNEHYYIAWPIGGDPIDRKSSWQVEKVLKAYKLKNKELICKVCGAKRVSCLGFYAHILACGKTEEEIDEYKDLCPLCNQKYLCIYRQQHFAFHSVQQLSKERKQMKAEQNDKLKAEEPEIDRNPGPPTGKRKAAEKARKFVLDHYGEYENPDSGSDCQEELNSYECGEKVCDEELSSDMESECPDVDSDSPNGDQWDRLPKNRIRKRKSVERKRKLMKLPFQVTNVKNYLKKSYIDFCNIHFTCDRLFVEWLPSSYEEMPIGSIQPYLPTLEESCKVMEEGGWTTYKQFEARFDKVLTFFTGAAPQCVSWVPPIYNAEGVDPSGNFLAVACHAGADTPRFDCDRCYTHKGLLQIWDFGQFDGALPSMVLGIAHEYGTIWAMDWCPSGARDELPSLPSCSDVPARMGLLAVACSNGAAYVLAVPYPSTLPVGTGRFFKMKPSVELRYDDQKQYQCTSLKWSAQKGHATIAVGYSNGTVAFYNLNGNSPLGQSEQDNVCLLYPYHDERIQNTSITGLDLFPSTEESADTGLITASSNSGVALLVNRGPTVARANVNATSSGVVFQPHWPSVLCMGEDPLAVSEVDWEGWRGRSGAQMVVTSLRRALVACAAPPFVRVALLHRLHLEQPRKVLAAIEMKPLSSKRKKEKVNTEFEMKVEPLTYEKAIKLYGLELTLLKKEKTHSHKQTESRPERFPLSEVAAMAFCLHPNHHDILIVATHTGIVFVLDADTRKLFPPNPKKL